MIGTYSRVVLLSTSIRVTGKILAWLYRWLGLKPSRIKQTRMRANGISGKARSVDEYPSEIRRDSLLELNKKNPHENIQLGVSCRSDNSVMTASCDASTTELPATVEASTPARLYYQWGDRTSRLLAVWSDLFSNNLRPHVSSSGWP